MGVACPAVTQYDMEGNGTPRTVFLCVFCALVVHNRSKPIPLHRSMNINTSAIMFLALTAVTAMADDNSRKALYGNAFFFEDEYNSDEFVKSFVPSIKVLTPEHTSYIKGDTTVVFEAPGMTKVKAFCWKQPDNNDLWADGCDCQLGEFKFSKDNEQGEFIFHAERFPNGPTAIRFYAKNDTGKQDYFELQLFNLGGVKWRQGIPKTDPPGAKGMKLAFADDFDVLPLISSDGIGARYAAHKTGGGDFSGWQFSDPAGDKKPFSQQGSYLRIHASKRDTARSGILSSLRSDGTGIAVPVPCYFECRFVAQNAPGSWPAFWTLTKGTLGMDKSHPRFDEFNKMGTDEFDIIEAYGGYGERNPNTRQGQYHSVSHFWNQDPQPDWYHREKDGTSNPKYFPHSFLTAAESIGEGSWWSWTPHTYGMALTETEVIYYFDNVEIGRHPVSPVTLAQPTWFLINYAIGGISGWQIDMERYGDKTDMWVDFVRVYCGAALEPEINIDGFVGDKPARVHLSTQTQDAVIRYSLDGTDPTSASPAAQGEISVSTPAAIKAIAFAPGLKPSPVAVARVTVAPGIAGSVALNFVTDINDREQNFTPNDVVGINVETSQAYWNSVPTDAKTASRFLTSDGGTSPITLTIEGEAKSELGSPWGFDDPNEHKLKRGNIASSPRLIIKGVPHQKYDVIVILGAGVNSVIGEVALKTAADTTTFSFEHGWLGGVHKQATTKPGTGAENSNYVLFSGVTSSNIEIEITKKGGQGWTGISGLQIIPRP